MAILIELDKNEKQELCSLLKEVEPKVSGTLKRDVKQARIIYCNVKKNLPDVKISDDNITKLSSLLMYIAGTPSFQYRAEKLYNVVIRKKESAQ